MPDFIYPTDKQDSLGSEREINVINWDKVAQKMRDIELNGDGSRMPDWLRTEIDSRLAADDESEARTRTAIASASTSTQKRAKKTLPDALREHMFKSKNDDDDSDSDGDEMVKRACPGCDEPDCPDCKKNKKATSSTRVRKVLFATPESLSPEAAEAARLAGDTELQNAILAERHNRRVRIAKRVIDQTTAQIEQQQKLAKRNEYRMKIVSSVNEVEKKLAQAKSITTKSASTKAIKADASSDKQAIAKRLLSQGFTQATVNEILGLTKTAALSDDEKLIREVMASNLPMPAKRTTLATMIRSAHLGPDQVARQIKYWSEDLGYGDEKWIHDLFATSYDTDGSENGVTES